MNQTLESQLISNRRLLWVLVARDLRARYAGSGLGIFWSVVHPLIMLVLYIIVFSTLMRGSALRVHGVVAGYAVFLIPALIAWNWFYESLIGAAGSITGNANLIKKVVFPSAILPSINIVAGAIPFAVTMALFLVFAWFMAGFSIVSVIYLPLLILLETALIIGPAYLFASLNVMLRDTSQFLIAALQFLFWGTPIVYTPEALTVPFPWLACWFDINPFAHLAGAYRDVIIVHRTPMLGSILYIAIVAIISYHAGRTLFLRSRSHFPDEV
ncbi:MAG: ABC transporter permease [bacterium]